MKFTVQDINSLKDRDILTQLQNASPTTPHHHITKGLFTAITFTSYIMSSYKKNYKEYQKVKKHTLKR